MHHAHPIAASTATAASAASNLPATPASLDEADIGSGERSPGQDETDRLIRQIPPLPQQPASEETMPGIVSPS